jgi:hypothetical protein
MNCLSTEASIDPRPQNHIGRDQTLQPLTLHVEFDLDDLSRKAEVPIIRRAVSPESPAIGQLHTNLLANEFPSPVSRRSWDINEGPSP